MLLFSGSDSMLPGNSDCEYVKHVVEHVAGISDESIRSIGANE